MNSDPDQQHPFLSYGFRPFFLFAGLYGTIAILTWLGWLLLHDIDGGMALPAFAGPPHLWHGHEMIFGYATAVLSGFILTAVPSWTGARRIAGTPLFILATVWLAGRLAMWFSVFLPPLLVALIDLAHLPLLAAFIAGGLLVRPAPRNLVFLLFLLLLTLANGAFHAEWAGFTEATASRGLEGALLLLSLMLAIIGGRIVPAFTRNALNRGDADQSSLPRSFNWLDRAAILSTAALAVLTVAEAGEPALGGVAAIAAIANLSRLSFWRWRATLASPILWSLHLSYGFLGLAFGALAVAHFTGWIGVTSAMHLLAIGAIGGMTLAVMTRASLGHTGRPLVTARPIGVAYAMVAAAAIVRSLGVEIFPAHYMAVLAAAALLWIGAFAIFSGIYLPILTGPAQRLRTA